MIDFTGATFLITGAASGIGLAMTETVLKAGAATVFMVDKNAEAVKKAAASLDPKCSRTRQKSLDVSSSTDCDALVQGIVAESGGIDHLVHCAGIYPPKALLTETSDADWRTLMSINLDGLFYICRAAAPHMNDNSTMVLCSSIAGHRGSYGHGPYAAAKAAVKAFGQTLALELAPRTRVNVVSPGIIKTSMTVALIEDIGAVRIAETLFKRFGEASEVASVMAFFCSPLSSYVTGETLHINGGQYMD